VGGVLVRMGVQPVMAAAGVGTLGALGAVVLDGRARDAALGASAVGAGQLVLGFLGEAEARLAASESTRNSELVDAAEVVGDDEEDPVEREDDAPSEDEADHHDLVIELARPRNGAPETLWDRLRSPSAQTWFAAGMAALPLLLLAWLSSRRRDPRT